MRRALLPAVLSTALTLAVASGASAAARCLSDADIDASLSPPATQAIDPLLDVTTIPWLEHRMFAVDGRKITTLEQIPGLERKIGTAIHSFTIATQDQILLTNGDTPLLTYTLSDACKAQFGWEGKTLEQRMAIRERAMGPVVRRVDERVKGVDRADLGLSFGYADVVLEGVRRYATIDPYAREICASLDLDEYLCGAIALKETFFRSHRWNPASGRMDAIVSSERCEGPFQISRGNAPGLGLVVPPPVRAVAQMVEQDRKHVNESLDPLLGLEAAARLARGYGMGTGTLSGGMMSYHAGPGRYWYILSTAMLYPTKAADEREAIARLISQELLDGIPLPTEPAYDIRFADEPPRLMRWISDVLRTAWRDKRNRSAFKSESSKYLPRLLAFHAILQSAMPKMTTTTPLLLGERLVRVPDGECGPRGPYDSTVSDSRCVRNVPVWGTRVETPGMLEFDMISVEYLPGAKRLVGEDLLPLFRSPEEFSRYNPHIPVDARRPVRAPLRDGVRVKVSRQASEAFFARFPAVHGEVTRYWDGHVSPLARIPEEPIDLEYAAYAYDRFQGSPADPELIQRLSDAMQARCARDRGAEAQCIAIREDLGLLRGNFKKYLDALDHVNGR